MESSDSLRVGSADSLVGRDVDLDRVRELLGQREGGALLLSGDPGVGKSALLDAVAAAAARSGTRVLRAAGAEFEADVSYSVLNQILLPLHSVLDRLSAPSREAMSVALGFGSGPPPKRLVVCNAALALLRSAAEDGPVLLVVDDLPWVDRASAAVFAFVARRSTGDRVRFLAASRTGVGSFFDGSGVPSYVLPALDAQAAAHLVDLRFPDLAHPVRQRLLDAARGNPLALLELPGALRTEQRAAQEVLPAVLPLGEHLQSLFGSRVRSLPAATRTLLLLATLDGTGDLGVLSKAAREMDGETDLRDLDAAEHDGLVRVDESSRRLVFRHPLIMSAVVETATSSSRRAAHRALAQVLGDKPEQRAWHLGEATLQPDEEVALLLERTAHRILNRGDAVAAIAALTRAADLSPLDTDRARRLAEAAYVGAEAIGALRGASVLLEDAWRADPGHGASLRSATAAVQLVLNSDGDLATAHRLLVGAIEQGDHGYDAEDPALNDALHFLLLLCNYGAREELWAPYYAAVSRLRPAPPPLLLVAARTWGDPARADAATLRELDEIIDGATKETDPARVVRVGTAALYPDRLAAVREASWRLVRQGREGGPVRRHIGALLHLCLDDYHRGRWAEALELSEEGLTLCSKSGYTVCTWLFQYSKGLVTASQGDTETAHALADAMTNWAVPRGLREAVYGAREVHALADIAGGNFDAAFGHVNAVSPAGSFPPYVAHATWVFFDLVESAVRTNRRPQAAAHVRALRETNVAGLSPRLGLLAAGSEALVTEDDAEAARLFTEALAAPDTDRWPFAQARVRLAQGERLRRARALSESEGPLTAALKTFQQLGSSSWAERARKELRAAGRVVPYADGGGTAALTAQEREIAELAATGLTNRQIAERLFISHRTVGAHLYQIYPKLGIASRVALRDVLRRTPPD
ncbi:AAA family ATPase [Streptomyces cocklensis]|uniref:LuxR family transcriptional regulator fused with ATPase domain n=1 Tax=Actinacidiphila cocklensis TaxID=887465 RepID=A0A9W4GUR9_9ACTN|nr:LuxR family transcriptional regulator [Actinacidiphila cocklensis]MDD1059866.1 AAA family ATPase [Actinacidiphila cocklensis]CAG6397165.1 LuxR family transcriptional regulator fused with ATPase domain [Actinacidiphila cocklensis]